jgi:hypothetical protein
MGQSVRCISADDQSFLITSGITGVRKLTAPHGSRADWSQRWIDQPLASMPGSASLWTVNHFTVLDIETCALRAEGAEESSQKFPREHPHLQRTHLQ